jgi:hypothetical protein
MHSSFLQRLGQPSHDLERHIIGAEAVPQLLYRSPRSIEAAEQIADIPAFPLPSLPVATTGVRR